MRRNILTLAILTLFSYGAWAETVSDTQEAQELSVIQVTGKRRARAQALPFIQGRKASDIVVERSKLKSRSATLGNALASEIGVHSNPFGGGASAPIIRGQEGVRVKILQNGSDVVDMSSLSPDHAVAADTLLAQQVELIRGTSTLLYASASPAGVINIHDNRIPQVMPKKSYEGEIALRTDTAAKEKTANAGITLSIGEHIAVRAEGLTRKSDNYTVPSIKLGETLNYVPDTHNRSRVGTLGISFIGSKGYLGVSYSDRKDRYGLPGHNHMLDNCSGHAFHTQGSSLIERAYLIPYPHLMEDADFKKNFHFHCGTEHDANAAHSHDNVYGHVHDHSTPGPWVAMRSKRYDLRGEWHKPFAGIDKIKTSLAYADYYHDERSDGKVYISPNDPAGIVKQKQEDAKKLYGIPVAMFANKGVNSRLELYHQPVSGWQGMFGIQYQTQKSRADRLAPPAQGGASLIGERDMSERHPLVAHTNKQLSLFAMEQFRYGDFLFEAGARWEKQQIPIQYDPKLLRIYVTEKTAKPDLSAYKQKAFSYSGTVLWDIQPNFRLSLMASHNERLPTPMELYYFGKHLATNSFEYGNKNLTRERSNNLELGWTYHGDNWHFKGSLYRNRFKNYIHNENVYRSGNLFARRYIQSQARFHGIEGELGYHISPNHEIAIFGDLVRGKLFGFPNIYGDKIYECAKYYDDEPDECEDYRVVGLETVARPNRYAPRVPPARLGIRTEHHFGDKWSASLEYTRVFAQNRTSNSLFVKEKYDDDPSNTEGNRLRKIPIQEDKTRGYHLLNAGISYRHQVGRMKYTVSLNGFNLLNQKIYIHNSFLPYVPQMGRNFVLGVNTEF